MQPMALDNVSNWKQNSYKQYASQLQFKIEMVLESVVKFYFSNIALSAASFSGPSGGIFIKLERSFPLQ